MSTLNKAGSAMFADSAIPRHHLCLLYETPDEQLRTIVPLIHLGLESNEKWLYIADDTETILARLQAAGIDTGAALQASALTFSSTQDLLADNTRSVPEAAVDLIAKVARRVESDGFSALRVVWEVGWALMNASTSGQLMACEAQLSKAFSAPDIRVICAYNRQQLEPATVLDVIHAHPAILMDGVECRNPYYIPFDQRLSAKEPSSEVEWLLRNLQGHMWATPQKQAEIETEAVSIISQLFLSFETLEDVYRDLPAMLSAYFQLPIAVISLYDEAAQEIVFAGAHGIPHDQEQPTRLPVAETICGRVVTTHKPVMEADISHICDERYDMLKQLGVKFFLCVPMQAGGIVLGTLWLADGESPKVPMPCIETFQIIANHLAQEIERKRTADALRESEERYRLITENMTDAVWLMDTNLVTTFISPSLIRTRGYSLEELKSMPWEKHLTPPSLEVVSKVLAEVWRPERLTQTDLQLSQTMELEFYRKDGSTIWSDVTISLIRDKEGNPSRLLGVGRDITERKQAEQALRASEKKYRQLIESLNEGVWSIDRNGVITFANRLMAEMLGYTPGEMLGRSLFDFTNKRGAKVFKENLRRHKAGLSSESDSEFVHKNGLIIYARLMWAPMTDDAGSYIGAIAGVMDITAHKQAEVAEREQRTLAEALRDTTIALNSTLSLDEVLDRILSNVGRVVPHDTASIMLIEDGVAHVAKARGFAERGLADWFISQHFVVNEIPTMRQMFETKQPVLIPDTRASTMWVTYPETSWMRSYVGAPIVIDGQMIGVIHLDNAKAGAFTANHAERLRAFAEHAAVAIHNAQLYEAEHYERIAAETLHEIAEAMASSAPLERILDLIITRLEQILQCDWTAIMLVQADFLHMVVAHGFPEQANILERVYQYPQIPLFYETLAQGNPIAISHAQDDPRWVPLPGFDAPVRGWIGVPIVIRDVVIGLLTAGSIQPYSYTDRDLQTVMSFAQHAALAFETTQVYSELESSLSDVRNLKAHMARTAQLHVAGEIATGIAHQVNNPLTTIIAETHLLMKQLPPSSTYHESAESIREAAYRAGTVVQRLLNFARVHPYSLQTLDINLSIERAVSLVRAQIEPHIARVVLDLAPDLAFVEASEEHLEDVWINLLLNARDAIHRPGAGLITITTRLNTHDKMIEISVQDNGIGIPADQLERIFAPFHTTKEHGTGLGLPICRDVVARHGGTIRVESEVGRGTVFIVSLPTSKKSSLTSRPM